jgi:hypothetical protein
VPCGSCPGGLQLTGASSWGWQQWECPPDGGPGAYGACVQDPGAECGCPAPFIIVGDYCECPEGQVPDANGGCSAPCAPPLVGTPPNCVCPGNQIPDGNGGCVDPCPSHLVGTPPNCTCPGGGAPDANGQCPAATCPSGTHGTPPNCCPTGQNWNGTQCVEPQQCTWQAGDGFNGPGGACTCGTPPVACEVPGPNGPVQTTCVCS